MDPVTVSLTDDHIALLEDLSGDGGPCKNRSEAMRMIIDQYTETKDLETENERLRRQLAATNQRVDEHQDLIEYVEEQREVERHRGQREQRRAQAGVITRAKWWLTGMPVDGDDDSNS